MMASKQISQQSRDLKKELDRVIDLKLSKKIKEQENDRLKLRIGWSTLVSWFGNYSEPIL